MAVASSRSAGVRRTSHFFRQATTVIDVRSSADIAKGANEIFRVDFHDIVSGRHRGLWHTFLRGVLRVAEVPYRWVVRYRNRQYDCGNMVIHHVSVPVISVGNITAGGTGKTPMVAWLARWFQLRQVRVVLVSRGYKAKGGAPNDEALELHQQLPDVPHVQNRDRVAAAEIALDRFRGQLIVLDDAFQHRRIHRDLDIVLIDALDPFGYGHLLPRGLLREPTTQLARADIVALSRAETIGVDQRRLVREQVQRLAPGAAWMELAHRPTQLVQSDGDVQPVQSLSGLRVAAFSGIGNPEGFRRSLGQLDCRIVAFQTYPDHHAFTATDLAELERWVAQLGPLDAVVCTCKDLVKLEATQIGNVPLWALAIEIDVLDGDAELQSCLQAILQRIEM